MHVMHINYRNVSENTLARCTNIYGTRTSNFFKKNYPRHVPAPHFDPGFLETNVVRGDFHGDLLSSELSLILANADKDRDNLSARKTQAAQLEA